MARSTKTVNVIKPKLDFQLGLGRTFANRAERDRFIDNGHWETIPRAERRAELRKHII